MELRLLAILPGIVIPFSWLLANITFTASRMVGGVNGMVVACLLRDLESGSTAHTRHVFQILSTSLCV